MLPFICLAFQVWFVWASPGFVHSGDSSKKSVTFPLLPVQQSLCNCIAVPLLHLGNFMEYTTRCKFAVTQNVVQKVEHSFATYALTHRPLCDMAKLHRHMFHAVPEKILMYYDLVPIWFYSKNVALVLLTCFSALTLSLWKSKSYTLHYINWVLSPLAALTHLTVLVHFNKTGSSRPHDRHVTAVLPVLLSYLCT